MALRSSTRLVETDFKGILREQSLPGQRMLDWVRVSFELPYPFDCEMAAAVPATQNHHVLTWNELEAGDDLGGWLLDNFVAEGITTLPNGAYLSTPDEVRDRFEYAEAV